MAVIYSLGSSLRSPEDFIGLLHCYRIEMLADVRRFPTSRLGYFKKEQLVELLQANTIRYCYLGEELGGYRKGG